MQSVAQSWLVYRLSGSAVLLGLVGFAGQIPVFLLALPAAAWLTARSRHKIILGTQTASMVLALVLAGLTLTGRVQLWHVFTLAARLGVVNALDIRARQAFLVELVGRADLMNAIALNSSMFNGARIIGPAVAGVPVAAIGEGWCSHPQWDQLYCGAGGSALDELQAPPRRGRPEARPGPHRPGPWILGSHGTDPRTSASLGVRPI